jgi:hypothetical protein
MSLFRLFSFNKLTKLELQREKAKDYRNVVILQILIVGCGLLLSEPLLTDSKSNVSKFIVLIFSGFGATYAFLLWDLLRNFTSNRYLIMGIFCFLSLIVVVGILVEFPYYQLLEVPNRQAYLLTIHGLLFPIEITVIAFAIRDIFAQGYLTPDKLWGAACVCLIIGISFGSLYDLLGIAMPGSMGVAIERGLPNYAECVTYSFCFLSGMDSGLQPIRFIRNLSVLEAVWGTLYGMIIIGQLLGLPR